MTFYNKLGQRNTATSTLDGTGTLIVVPRSTMVLNIPLADFVTALAAWQEKRMLVQHAFPTLTADEREFLMTGMTQADWDAAFPPEDE